MDDTNIKEIEAICSGLVERMSGLTERWDWDLAGGSWPIDPGTLEGLAQLSKGLKSSVERGTDHRMERQTLRSYRWKRVYDGDGRIDYDLVQD